MPSYTDNLGLVKWNPDDFWNASDYNENMEKLDNNAGNNDSNMAYVAVKSGNNWQLPSGKNAAIGEFIVLNGVLGRATAAITGGSTNIVSGTNWTPETKGGLNALNDNIESLNQAIAYRQALTGVAITSDGFYASDIPIGKVISAVYGAGSSRFVLVRPSSSGMAVFHLFDDTMQKVTSTTVTINVWRIP